MASKGVTNEGQKVALLLHSGAIELLEIYYTPVSEDQDTSFNDCVAVLDNYFTPEVNVPFERHVFRQMQQMEGETIDQFVCRLRQKAISCEFPNVDEAIGDQIIEECRDPKLRRKFLEKSSEATLTVLQETARVHEVVNAQMQSMKRPEQVNKLSPNDRQAKEKGTKGKKPGKERKCYRCGETRHLAQDMSCPALDKTCNKCRQSQPRNLVEDTVQKELIKSQKRKKKKITMLLCWIQRVVMARVVFACRRCAVKECPY